MVVGVAGMACLWSRLAAVVAAPTTAVSENACVVGLVASNTRMVSSLRRKFVEAPAVLAVHRTIAGVPQVWSPVFVPVRFATAAFASIAFVITPFAIAVALPVEVTTPVKLALVVTVVASATPILAVPSKEVPPIVRAVVSFGADTIVITGVVVVVATVASAFAEVTEDTVPANTISQAPSNDTLLIVFIFVPETRVACFASRADCVAVDIGRLLTAQSPIALDAEV